MASNVPPWTPSSYRIARHGLNIHHRKIHHWSHSQLHSPVSAAFSSPKWRRHFFWGFLFVLLCKQPRPEQSSRVLTHPPWLAGVEDMLSRRSRCEDSSCTRRHTNLSCLKRSRSFRLPTALGGPAARRGLLPSHSRRRSSLLRFHQLSDSKTARAWKAGSKNLANAP